MQDRVSLYPGRVRLTPVSGQENTYDMVRADEPTQEGDPLSKATFLKDDTAALFGLDATAVPDDVLNAIKNLISANTTLANTKAKIATGSYKGTGTFGASNPNTLTFPFTPKVVLFFQDTRYRNGGGNATEVGLYFWGVGAYWYNNSGGSKAASVSGNTMTWYSTENYIAQMNDAGSPASATINAYDCVYKYIAIG